MKLTLSYAGFLVLAGTVLFIIEAAILLNYQPPGMIRYPGQGIGRELFKQVALAAAVVAIILVVFGLVGGWFLAGRMLAPLTRITQAARTAATGSLSHRVALAGPSDEFRELADAFDTMLARLEAHVGEQRRFAANASHELRTPLAITRSLLEVALSDPDHDSYELEARLRAVNARAIELTEALLMLSRAEQRSFTAEWVDLSLVAEEAVETLLPVAEARGIMITVGGDIASTVGSKALLTQMTMNLLHNAIVHNLADGGRVWIQTTLQPRSVELLVENTGEVVAAGIIPTLTEPFQRGQARVRTDHAGVGLGLAIVKSIIQAHNADLTLVPRSDGGLIVRATFPIPSL
jgi:two-component system sensor histidine kinase VanS